MWADGATTTTHAQVGRSTLHRVFENRYIENKRVRFFALRIMAHFCAVLGRSRAGVTNLGLHVRPIHHRLADRVKAHIFICMLAYYVEWHMRQKLAPVLFDDEQPGQRNGSAVSPARRSASALTKAKEKRTSDNAPVQSFRDWLKDLATIARNRIQPKLKSIPEFEIITRPTAAQQRALTLLGITL